MFSCQVADYNVPVHMVERVEKEIQQMMRDGIIERSCSSYAAPMVIVRKRNSDELRVCVNFSKLNAIPVVDPMPQHEPDNILVKLGTSKIYSSFDASRGYWATPVEKDTKDLLTFNCNGKRLLQVPCHAIWM